MKAWPQLLLLGFSSSHTIDPTRSWPSCGLVAFAVVLGDRPILSLSEGNVLEPLSAGTAPPSEHNHLPSSYGEERNGRTRDWQRCSGLEAAGGILLE